MELAFGSGVHSLGWTAGRPGAHTARAALSYVWNQIENGGGCPVGMAYSAIPSLRLAPAIRSLWEGKVLADAYDPRPVPIAEKAAATIGMALTEKQGGSDGRANVTRAVSVSGGGPGGEYRLTGHKWFCSAPMSDAFLTLAQTGKGPSCFFVPRSLPDGTRNRFFIQRVLAEQPLMRNVLAFRLARAVDEAAAGSEEARLLERILTPVAKFWNCKRAPAFVAECVECHGGNGFIEEQPMPRLYREAPLNGIWEGTGNVICLDVLRALQREPDTVAALLADLSLAHGANRQLDLAIDALDIELSDVRDQEHRARQITAQIATVVEAALFVRHSIPAAADAFVASRLEGLPNRAFGSLPRDCDLAAIVARSRLS